MKRLILLFLLYPLVIFAQPTISSFLPTSGPIGASVIISGTNFNTTASNNVVYFGATKATISAASTTSLTVIVPVGATYQNISVTDLTTGLIAYSTIPFIATFSCGSGMSFGGQTLYSYGGTNIEHVAIGDLDGDGKSDVAAASTSNNVLSIQRNISTSGTITLAPKVDYTPGQAPYGVSIADLDGDGKLDVAVACWFSGFTGVSIFRNTSTIGTISFAPRIDLITGSGSQSIAASDLDLDGKAELVTANANGGSISVFKNTSSISSITFATKVDYTIGAVGFSTPRSIAIGDLNGDAKPDIAVADSYLPTAIVFKNTSTLGVISLAAHVSFSTGSGSSCISIGDLDGDLKADLVTANDSPDNLSILRNTSTSGSISFAAKINYSPGNFAVAICDLDGDGKPDLALSTPSPSNSIAVAKNNSTVGTISFAACTYLSSSIYVSSIALGDLDGDLKPDITFSSGSGTGYVATMRNTLNILPGIAGTITGSSTVCQGQSGYTYTVPAITNASSYVWTLPSGATGTSTTNSITVNYGTSATSGNITVKGNNSCGDGTTSSLVITVNPLPVAAGTITGTATVCQGQNSVTYTVPTITNATSYVWTLPGGATGTSTTNSITVDYGTSATSGNITVKGNNSCGDGTTSTLAITVNPLPVAAGTITGTATVCQGQNSVTYTVPTITNATSYVWTLPGGATGTSTTNSITVDYGTSATSGNITVKGNNSCGDGTTSTLAITVNPLPVSAGAITGTTAVCQGQNSVTYSVPAITNATSYVWTLPSGATGTSTSNSITVNYGTSATSGNITVKGNNSCGDGTTSTLAITVNPLPVAAGTITGTATVCQGQNSVTYTVPTITNATSYVWTLPGGATGTSTTNSITVDYGTSATSGNITVKGNNSCGDGTTSTLAITVNPLPVSAGAITGTTAVCQGQNSVTYSVPAITNATSYVWTLPSGATGTSTSNSITVNYGTSATSGNITVKGNNSCGDGTTSTLAITVNPLPVDAGTITGTTAVCQGQNSVTYTVPAITNATSYDWTLPSGATGTSTTNSITVDYGTSATSGNITVKGNNACGDGATSTLAITVNPLPIAAGTITGTATVCQGQSSVTYTVPVITNATTYVWTLPSGATGTSTTNSITVDYGTSATSGNITVKGNNSCGDGTTSTLAITVNPLPVAAGTITGTTAVCQEQNSVTYTVPAITNATSYVWTLPSGATGTSTTNSITVDYGTSATSGNITVKGNNACGDGATSTLTITVNPLPIAAGTITGTATVCQGQSSVTYTVPVITNATTYVWTLPSGATGTSTTNSITVDYGTSATSGNITVKGNNACGDGTTSTIAITVNPLPVAAGTITGTTAVCQGQNSVTYTVPAITNATSYVWTLPSGATGTSTTNSITVDYGISAASGNITVKGNNACGDGITSTLAITVNPIPATPTITLSGNTLLSDASSGNQWYDQSGSINGAINQSYSAIVDGDYFTIVTLLGCSSDTSNIINVFLTDIEALPLNNIIKIYPNPVLDELTIEIDGNNQNQNFEILNAIGEVIFKGNFVEKTTIQTSNFAPGMYLIKLENGKTFEFKKFIKK